VDTRLLQLTLVDDDIYSRFRQEFPDFAVDNIEEASLKSEDAKMVCTASDTAFYFVARMILCIVQTLLLKRCVFIWYCFQTV